MCKIPWNTEEFLEKYYPEFRKKYKYCTLQNMDMDMGMGMSIGIRMGMCMKLAMGMGMEMNVDMYMDIYMQRTCTSTYSCTYKDMSLRQAPFSTRETDRKRRA